MRTTRAEFLQRLAGFTERQAERREKREKYFRKYRTRRRQLRLALRRAA